MFLFSSDDPGSWDLAAVEPSTCQSEGQDLAEPETLEAETVLVSILHMRALESARMYCSISVTRAANPPNVSVTCDSNRDIQLKRIGICASCTSK